MSPLTEAESKLAGGVAVITGAGAGIGSAFARRAGELGMTVIVTYGLHHHQARSAGFLGSAVSRDAGQGGAGSRMLGHPRDAPDGHL